jgi:putative nucleotidyltransferase-like protein
MIACEQFYASLILRLLLDGEISPDEKRNIVWGDLLYIAAQNGVLIRVVDQLETLGLEPRHFFSAAVKDMRTRNQRKLALIGRISARCSDSNVECIFPKSVQNYPDMPGDIDLYVLPHLLDIDRVILRGLQAFPIKRSLRNRIDGTANYRLRACDSLLEIHHGRLGMLGEHRLYISQIIDNGFWFRFEGDEILIPSPEDQLILQSLQRVVQRSYLRLSDVVVTINLLRRNVLNWNYIIKTVNDLNIFYGLRCYLSFIDQIHQTAFGANLPAPPFIVTFARRRSSIQFRNGFYRFRRIRVGGRGYVYKFCSALRHENWTVATRLSLLPVLALITVVRKLRTS